MSMQALTAAATEPITNGAATPTSSQSTPATILASSAVRPVALSSASASLLLADAVGQGTITNDDAPSTLSINDVSRVEGSTGRASAFVFTVTLSAPAQVTGVTVSFDRERHRGGAI